MADQKISALTANPSIDGTEEFPVAKGGANFKNTLQELKDWIGIKSFKKVLTVAEIKTLFSIPVQVIPAPGIGKAIQIISASTKYDFVSAVYIGAQVFLQSQNVVSPDPADGYWQSESGVLLSQNSNVFRPMNLKSLPPDVTKTTIIENDAIMVVGGTDSLVGDGIITIYGLYQVLVL